MDGRAKVAAIASKVVIVIATGAVAAAMPEAALKDIVSELIATLAVLAAFLVQLMFLLATVFNPGRLKAAAVEQIAAGLSREQRRATTLFGAYVLAIGVLLIVKITGPAGPLATTFDPAVLATTARPLAGIAGLVFGYCAVGTFGFLGSLQSIQALRHKLLILEARDRDQEERKRASERVAVVPPASTSGSYGQVFRPVQNSSEPAPSN